VRSLTISPNQHVFAGNFSGGIFRSTDNGESWTPVHIGSGYIVRSLAINASGHIFAGTNEGGILRSTDDGGSWTAINAGLTNSDFRALAINASGHIFAGTQRGVLGSTDGGDNWAEVNTGLNNRNVWALAIQSTGHIFAGTFGSGVFRSLEPTSPGDIPTSFLLAQNYPNPVGRGPLNFSTTFEFDLPRFGHVTLKVYNLLGQEVAVLVAGNLFAGKHRLQWNVAGVAGGIYFYRLQTGDFVEVKKLVVAK
jgi:hypothetical protein